MSRYSRILLTPLADGADRLGAYAAMECGIPFIAPLPMPVDEYRKDFTTLESLDEFNELVLKAAIWFELPLPQGTKVEELQQSKEKRIINITITGCLLQENLNC